MQTIVNQFCHHLTPNARVLLSTGNILVKMGVVEGGLKLDFDKKSFAVLLNLAKGERSINRFGQDAGVDPGYLSRLLRGLLDTAPSAAVIKKLGRQAANGVDVQDLLLAAGYIDSPNNSDIIKQERIDKFQQMQAWEKVIEEAALYNISPEVASELIRTLGQSIEKIKKAPK